MRERGWEGFGEGFDEKMGLERGKWSLLASLDFWETRMREDEDVYIGDSLAYFSLFYNFVQISGVFPCRSIFISNWVIACKGM